MLSTLEFIPAMCTKLTKKKKNDEKNKKMEEKNLKNAHRGNARRRVNDP